MRGGQNDSQGLVTMGLLERGLFLKVYDKYKTSVLVSHVVSYRLVYTERRQPGQHHCLGIASLQEFSGGGPRQMASHLGNASARNVNSQSTWIESLHAFGSYCIGHLPRESKLVENTTLDDRGLEGAFLMSDHSTLTFWMWSFKFNKPMKMCDGIFYPTYPFRDPSVLST